MGTTYHRKSQATNAINQIKQAKQRAKAVAIKHAVKLRVLVLMGLPGASYMIATNKSYVGDLVAISGGKKNVFASKSQEYIQPNDEEIKRANPQVILRLAHALPQIVVPQFNSEFKSDPMWRTVSAVKHHRFITLKSQILTRQPICGQHRRLKSFLIGSILKGER